jgi:hypothetical protein
VTIGWARRSASNLSRAGIHRGSEKEKDMPASEIFILVSQIERLLFFAMFCVAWFNFGVIRPSEALGVQKKTVLVLYGDPQSTPADRMTEQGLTAALSSGHGWELEVFSEYLDLMRFPAVRYGDDIGRYLGARYGTRKPDVLLHSQTLRCNSCLIIATSCFRGADRVCRCRPS